MGALGYAGQAFTFFTALTLAPAGLVALLLYLHPALVAVLSAVLLHERLSTPKVVALVVALAGMALTVLPTLGDGAPAAHPGIASGVAFGVAAAAIYAGYILVGARVGRGVAAARALGARPRARASNARPSKISTTITAAASK